VRRHVPAHRQFLPRAGVAEIRGGRSIGAIHGSALRFSEHSVRCMASEHMRPRPAQMAEQRGVVSGVSWSPDGRRLASTSQDRPVKVWDVEKAQAARPLRGHADPVLSVCWNPGGCRLASASEDKMVRLWDSVGGRLVHTLGRHTDVVRGVCWSPDGTRLACPSGRDREALGGGRHPQRAHGRGPERVLA
jgi:WD40 repeat protein